MERIQIGNVSLEVLIAGDGPPLLFLHGGGYFAQHREFLDRLARRWRVAPRHPGFGNSEAPEWLRSVNDLAYLYLDLLESRDFGKATTLVGASFGGWVALEICVRCWGAVDRLVLIDSVGVKFG